MLQSHLLSKGQAQMKASQNGCCCQAGSLCSSSVSRGSICLSSLFYFMFFCLFANIRDSTSSSLAFLGVYTSSLCHRPTVREEKKMGKSFKDTWHETLSAPPSSTSALVRGRQERERDATIGPEDYNHYDTFLLDPFVFVCLALNRR